MMFTNILICKCNIIVRPQGNKHTNSFFFVPICNFCLKLLCRSLKIEEIETMKNVTMFMHYTRITFKTEDQEDEENALLCDVT